MTWTLLLFNLCLGAAAQPSWEGADFFPGTDYDHSIPEMKPITGFDFGEKISMHHEAMMYARALSQASPKVHLQIRGKTWEDRAMALLFISDPHHIAQLEKYQQAYGAIADPRTTDKATMENLTRDLPVLVWLQESVHGNEISGTDSGLLLAWHLAAARNNPEVERVLKASILVIELMQNPDGRDRFISYSRQHRSPNGGDPDPQAAERSEPWPSGRFNHYNFDMNRDWIAQSQPETRTKTRSLLEWHPQVVVDLHEMGSNESFFAAKPSPPANPLLNDAMLVAYEQFGKAIGKVFDARGIDYFHGEIFDSFYPGYGESWPSLHGAMGILFEQGSARGLRVKRKDGSVLTYRQSVVQQALASMAVLAHAAEQRREMLAFYYQNRAEPLGLKDDRQVFLLPGDDPARTMGLGRLLQAQGIEVFQVQDALKGVNLAQTEKGKARKSDIPEGALSVRWDQPAGKLAQTLLSLEIPIDEAFLNDQKRRIRERQRPRIYDVTAWSLPLLHGVHMVRVAGNPRTFAGDTRLKAPYETRNMDAKLGYLIPGSFQNGILISNFLQRGLKLHYTTKPITHGGRHFPSGSLVLKRRENPDTLGDTLEQAANRFQVTVIGINSSWFDQGPSLGSPSVLPLKAPKIAMLWNTPADPMSAGWMRYVVEQQFAYPLTALRTDRLGRYDLGKYNVLLVPDGASGNWNRALGAAGAKQITQFVNGGGVLVAIGGSAEWLTEKKVGLLASAREWRGGLVDDKKNEKQPKKLGDDPEKMILPTRERPVRAFGALLRVNFQADHWICSGMPETHAVMVNSNRIFRPLRLNSGRNPGRFASRETLLLSGFVPTETLSQVAHKPFLMTARKGRGLIIAFTEDPNYRALTRGLQPLFANAVFFGPAQNL